MMRPAKRLGQGLNHRLGLGIDHAHRVVKTVSNVYIVVDLIVNQPPGTVSDQDRGQTLAEIAKSQGVTLTELQARIEAAANAHRGQ